MTQVLHMPTIPIVLPNVRDILEPSLNEEARAAYLEGQLGLKVCPKEYKIIVRKEKIKGNMNGKLIG